MVETWHNMAACRVIVAVVAQAVIELRRSEVDSDQHLIWTDN